MIWHVIDSRGLGGAERHITTLACSTIHRGVEASAVLLSDHGRNPWIDQLHDAGVQVQVLSGSWRDLYQHLRFSRPCLVHTHGYKAGIWGRPAARMCGIPVVSTFHSGERSTGRMALYELVDEWSSFLGSSIAVSNAVAQRLPFRCHVVPSYVRALEAGKRKQAPPERVAFVGRLSPEKGADVFCELATRVDSRIGFDVYGDGPMRGELERKYFQRVRFHGAIVRMECVWPTVSLLIMPSQFEGLPLAALEAMAHGVAVLATPVGGLRSLVVDGQTGWFFDISRLDGAAEKINAWFATSDIARDDMRRRCREFVARHYSEAEHFPRVAAVYRDAGLAGDVLAALELGAPSVTC